MTCVWWLLKVFQYIADLDLGVWNFGTSKYGEIYKMWGENDFKINIKN